MTPSVLIPASSTLNFALIGMVLKSIRRNSLGSLHSLQMSCSVTRENGRAMTSASEVCCSGAHTKTRSSGLEIAESSYFRQDQLFDLKIEAFLRTLVSQFAILSSVMDSSRNLCSSSLQMLQLQREANGLMSTHDSVSVYFDDFITPSIVCESSEFTCIAQKPVAVVVEHDFNFRVRPHGSLVRTNQGVA